MNPLSVLELVVDMGRPRSLDGVCHLAHPGAIALIGLPSASAGGAARVWA